MQKSASNHPVRLSWGGRGCNDPLLCAARTLQSSLERRKEATIVHIDFSAAFDRVYRQGNLFKLCYVGVGSRFCAACYDTVSL